MIPTLCVCSLGPGENYCFFLFSHLAEWKILNHVLAYKMDSSVKSITFVRYLVIFFMGAATPRGRILLHLTFPPPTQGGVSLHSGQVHLETWSRRRTVPLRTGWEGQSCGRHTQGPPSPAAVLCPSHT